ncbi:TOMM precursor leader peptide-binding protein [Sorangium sp. So ce296]|uniref:TOMM precursor leader peptide-binding protein n=1 Tax=Sorangium sp. So ce296 TaxID=3133296 RepID=UPI003F5F57FA
MITPQVDPLQKVLRFKRHLLPRLLDDERVFLIGGLDPVMLKGRTYALVVPLIDGRRTVAQILAELSERAPPPNILFTLVTLERDGYVVAVSPSLSARAAAFWEAQGVDADRASARLASTPVTVHGMSRMADPVVDALRGVGTRVQDDALVHVVVVDDYLDSRLEDFNRRSLQRGLCWTLLKPAGLTAWLGPVFRPGTGPCWNCMACRLRINRPVEAYLERHAMEQSVCSWTQPEVPTSIQASVSLAAIALSNWIVNDGAGPLDDLLTVDLLRFSTQSHAVVRYPQCPACGAPALATERVSAPVVLECRPKRFTDDGGHRTATPEETWQRFAKQVSPVTGVVASVGPIPERDHPLRPVYGAAYRVCPVHAAPSFDDFHRVAMGKGRTSAQARASALCEAIERHSLCFRGDEPRRRACFDELDDEGVHPDELQNFSEAQFRQRDRINAGAADKNRRVPMPFDPSISIEWSPVWSLTHGRRRWIPTSYCYTELPVPPEERFCYVNPNGNAAGNCLEEAILQGFLELVERDAVAIWWYNRLRRPRVDLASFSESYFLDLEAHYRSMKRRIFVLDITTDLGIPAFAALGLSEGGVQWHIGFGCHIDARLGVQRALTELNQLFDPDPSAPVPWDVEQLTDTSFLLPDETVPARARDHFPLTHRADLRDDVLDCVARASRAGLETLVLDQTRLDVGLCAVKVIVPGLRLLWPRFGRGRLYDVPVRIGLLEERLTEAELNPVALYL